LPIERRRVRRDQAGRSVRVDEEAGAVREIEAAAGDEAHAGRLRRVPGADDAGDAVPVGDAERGEAEQGGGGEQLVREEAPRRKLKWVVVWSST
jgi:hypothetical protein